MAGHLLCVGNPLLDISTNVGADYLEKYGLKPGNAILADPPHLPIYEEIKKHKDVVYIAGGAAQNTARVAQWMIGVPQTVSYIGCIGKDENGQSLKHSAESAGVATHYLVDETVATGTCAVLIVQKERSMVTHLGAANNYKITHAQSPAVHQVIEQSQYYYSTGYFLTVSPDTLVHIGKHAAEHNKPFLFNLAAPFVIQFFFDAMSSVLPYVDVLFSNEDEAKTFGQKQGWGEDIKVVAEKLAGWTKVNSKRPRTIIFTQGAHSTIVFHDGKISEFHPLRVASEEIVDLNGAGDSFAGGFLSGYVQGKDFEKSVSAGHYAASEVIKRSGCTFPAKSAFSF